MTKCIQVAAAALLFLFNSQHSAIAQPFRVSGTVQSDGQPMPGATVKATAAEDSTRFFGAISDANGAFELTLPPRGTYLVNISYIGFETFSKVVTAARGEQLNLGTVRLKATTTKLEGVEVQAVAERVTIQGDTAIYNADAFKVNRDADARQLLEKMPGVTNSDGGVSVQGERVQRVLIDGKEFFSGDPKTALNTIPAEIIDKIQVFDQLSEQSQFTGFNDGNTTKTINIITKSGKNQGEFGKVFAGYGTDNRYLTGGNLNRFNQKERLSVLALSNNVNQVNFATEDIAGAIGSSVDAINNPQRGPRRPAAGTGNANDFLVPPQAGINTTTALGLNYGNEWGKLKFNGSYLFNTTANENDNTLLRSFLGERTSGLVYREQNIRRSDNINHRINLRAEYDIDDKNSVLLRPSISFQRFDARNTQNFATSRLDTLLSSGTNQTTEAFDAVSISNELLYRRKLAKKGQTISLSIQNSYNTTNGDGSLLSEIITDESTSEPGADWRSVRNQLNQNHRANLSYTHPLGEKLSLEVNYNPQWRQSTSDWRTRVRDAADDYSVVDSSLSNSFTSTFLTHEARLRLRKQLGKGDFAVAGLNYEYTENINEQSFPTPFNNNRIYRNFLPFALYRKVFTNKASLFALYRMSANLPSIQQLNTVIDNSNPTQISVGNADLDQALGHRFIVRFNQTNAEKGTNFFAFINADAQNARIANSTALFTADTLLGPGVFLPAGGQITRPVNLDGFYSVRTFVNYGFPVKALQSNLNFNGGLNYQRSPGLINEVLNIATTKGANAGFLLGSNISERVDFKVGANAAYNWVSNTTSTRGDFNFQTYTANVGGVFTPIPRWVISSDLTYNIFRGLGNLDQEFTLWNVGLGHRFLKDESLELRLTVFDLLSQNNAVARNATETFVEDSQTAILQRYLMVSLSYRLRNFRTNAGERPPSAPKP